MFAKLRRLLGQIKIIASGDIIKIDGLPADVIEHSIKRYWESKKIGEWMFNTISNDSLSFNSFFLPDFAYVINTLINDHHGQKNIRALRKLYDELFEQTWLKDTLEKKPDVLNLSRVRNLNVPLLEKQTEFLATYNDLVPRWKLFGYALGAKPGTGKAQPLNALIKTPNGWSTMGDMMVGTEVITPKGTVTTVTGVYPQGMKDIYKITFSDGRIAECCEDHLWKVHFHSEETTGYWKIKTTKEILESYSYSVGRAYIPLIDSEDGPLVDLPIHPYILGVLLGDANISHNAIIISNPDDFIKEKVKGLLDDGVEIGNLVADIEYNLVGTPNPGIKRFNPLLSKLRELNLMGTHSHTKFIPEVYLTGSRQQRLDLLNGLLDTDGTTDKSGSASYCTTSLDLAENVQYLVRSLGGIASLSRKNPVFTYKGEKKNGRVAFQINIRHKNPEELFSLPRKKERLNNNNQYAATLKLRIDKIELDRKFSAQCISLADEDHLYITNNFVVTHNTITCIALGECLEADIEIFIVPKNAVLRVWKAELENRLVSRPQVWHSLMGIPPKKGLRYYVFHYEALEAAIAFASTVHARKPFIALDESHNFNEWDSRRTQLFIQLCAAMKCQNVIWSSGTLIKAIGKEAMPLLTTIDPLFTPAVAERFKKIFGMNTSRAVDILRHRLGLVTFKADRTDDLAEPVVKSIPVTIPNGNDYTLEAIREVMSEFIKTRMAYYQTNMAAFTKHYNHCLAVFESKLQTPEEHADLKKYKAYVKQIQKGYDPIVMKEQVLFCNKYELSKIVPLLPQELKNEFKDLRSIIKYYFLKVQGEALGRVFGKKRMQCNVDMVRHSKIEDIIDASIKKTLIFTSYVEVVDEVFNYLTELGYKPARVYGDTNSELASIIGQFEQDPDLNPLIATFQSLSTAVPMVMANTEILLNSPFRPHEREQTIARVDRKGQDTQTYIFDVLLDTGDKPNISTRSQDIMKMAEEQVEAILGNRTIHLSDHIAAESFNDYIEGIEESSEAIFVPSYANWD